MRVWVFCFILLFGLAELLQWLKQFSLPLPIFILGGAFLAIASNYERRAGFPFNLGGTEAEKIGNRHPTEIPNPTNSEFAPKQHSANYQNSDFLSKTNRPISFTIRKPDS